MSQLQHHANGPLGLESSDLGKSIFPTFRVNVPLPPDTRAPPQDPMRPPPPTPSADQARN